MSDEYQDDLDFEDYDGEDRCTCPHCGSWEHCEFSRCTFCGGRMDGTPIWLESDEPVPYEEDES